MTNSKTIARPYAKAIFAVAKQDSSYDEWSKMLRFFNAVSEDPVAFKFLTKLAISAQDKANFLCDLMTLTDKEKNLIKVLSFAKRLAIIPYVYSLYEELRRKAENKVNMHVIVARNTEDQELKLLMQSIQGDVLMSESEDKNLLGGGVVKLGNRVVDGSIRGRLQALHDSLISG